MRQKDIEYLNKLREQNNTQNNQTNNTLPPRPPAVLPNLYLIIIEKILLMIIHIQLIIKRIYKIY